MVRRRLEEHRRSIWDVEAVERALDREDLPQDAARAVRSWLCRHAECRSWEEVDWKSRLLRGVPERVRGVVCSEFVVRTTTVEERSDSRDGTTSKLVVKLCDGLRVETVVIRHQTLRSRRVTVCVSSQVGCQMACSFCATGTMGLLGDLSSAEIVEQFLHARSVDERASRVVFMGMGEPLNNYECVVQAGRVLLDNKLFALGKVTVSTVGISSKIRRLGRDEARLNLALSLHAPTQRKRESIMPAARADPLEKLVDALNEYVDGKAGDESARAAKKRGPLVMIEYILLGGVNDTDADADDLGALLTKERFGRRAMVNLIAYNPVPGLPYDRPTEARVRDFQRRVQAFGILTCVRKTMGDDVSGACGQLVKQAAPEHNKASLRDIEDVLGEARRKTLQEKSKKSRRAPKPREGSAVWTGNNMTIAAAVLLVLATVYFYYYSPAARLLVPPTAATATSSSFSAAGRRLFSGGGGFFVRACSFPASFFVLR